MRTYLLVCCVLIAQSCPTLCDPMDCHLPGSSVHRILQARILEKGVTPFSRGFFLTEGSHLGHLHWQVDSLHWATGYTFAYRCINTSLLINSAFQLTAGKGTVQLSGIHWRGSYFLLYTLLCLLNFELQRYITYVKL